MDLWKPIMILEDCWNVDHVAQCGFPVDRNWNLWKNHLIYHLGCGCYLLDEIKELRDRRGLKWILRTNWLRWTIFQLHWRIILVLRYCSLWFIYTSYAVHSIDYFSIWKRICSIKLQSFKYSLLNKLNALISWVRIRLEPPYVILLLLYSS